MKDDLVEQAWEAFEDALEQNRWDGTILNGKEAMAAALTIARPAIRKEAIEEAAEAVEAIRPCWEEYEVAARRIRALATTGQEGGR